MPIEVGVDYWPVAGVTEPQHHWPFSVTGNYTDQGSTGGLDLTEQSSGNSFNSGLVLNGSGWATGANNADICNLGSTFSILFEGSWGTAAATGLFSGSNYYYETPYDGWSLLAGWSGTGGSWRTVNPQSTLNDLAKESAFTPGTNYQIIVVHNSGTSTCYVNGSPVSGWSGAMADPTNMSTRSFAIGAVHFNGGFPLTGTIKRAAVLKGTAWSADDVAAIYTAFS